jgi:DNA recombination protein RmuC
MEITAVFVFMLGLLFGFGIGYLSFKNRQKNNIDKVVDIDALKEELVSLRVEKKNLEERIQSSIEEFKKQKEREQSLVSEKEKLHGELSAVKSDYKHLKEKLDSQKAELEQLEDKFTKEFKLVANSVLRRNSEEFSKSHQKELDQILSPLKEKLNSFEKKVEDRYEKNRDEQMSLKTEIKNLTSLNSELNLQAQNLTKALKGESKKQGNWGELVLERILESSGLIKGEEYVTQFSDTNVENKRIQPDVLVKLPDEKHIIIDSKVSLVAYERFVNAEEDTVKEEHLKLHLSSVRTHVKQLGEKNYQSGIGVNSPDFVLLFIPVESSFSLAIQEDPELYAFAWDKKVIIVSPTTLLATLRTIASVWKHERQTQNAIEIADRAGRLYDKFKAFVDDMQKIEKGISNAQNAYDDAFNKLKSGRGNLIGRAEKIKALGAKASKDLPKELIEFDEDE